MYLREMRPDQIRRAVEKGWPLLVPAGCVENHGPHMAVGLDTLVVEELCRRIADRVQVVIAPSFDYGATGYAVSGPEAGTIDVDNTAFGLYVKSILTAFYRFGFPLIYVIVHHQGMDGPLALAFRKAGSEVMFEMAREAKGEGWWGRTQPTLDDRSLTRIRVQPSILPAAREAASGDHAGLYETSLLLAARPKLVDMDKLQGDLPWFCTHSENPSIEGSAELGERMFRAMADAWVDELRKQS
jgi:creatinine amidohydrolase